MIEKVRLRNFKCFEDRTFLFGNITLLSGLNGMGKSTLLQALLLLRQSVQQGTLPGKGAALNGDILRLGTGKDVLFEDAQQEEIAFELVYDQTQTASWKFFYEADADLLALKYSEPTDMGGLLHKSLFNDDFHYLQAERIGPRPSFEVSDYIVDRHRQLGTRGEYTAHFLAVYGNQDIAIRALEHPAARSRGLIHQIEAWMSIVSPGVQLEISSHRGMDLVNLQYSFVMGQKISNSYRATNVGFGITYTLPILTAILSSKPGSLILLENPEAHLHSRGQVYIGELLALAAANGIQVVVETHSDHILNGIRLAVHGGKITPEMVNLYYFGRQNRDGQVVSQVIEPRIDRNGRIDRWPEGFFDELDNSLERLLEPAKGSE